MTIGTSQTRISLNCDGVTTVFPVPIQAYQATDLTVILTAPASAGGTQTTLTLNSQYTLATSGTLQPTAWTLTTVGTAYPAGYTLQVFINPVQQQQTQYVQGQAFPSLAVQTNLDRLTQMVQRLQDQVNRSIRVPDGDVAPSMLLPVTGQRLTSYTFFDANGNVAVSPIAPATLNPSYLLNDVRLFGAKLDGATDDTAAVAAAISLTGAAFVPYTAAGIVLNQLNLTGTLYTNAANMNVYAKAGASYAIKIATFGCILDGFSIQDTGNVVSQTTTSATASGGATSITVTSATQGPGIQAGQRIAIELASGYWHATYVTSVVGTTANLYTAIPSTASVNSGTRVWSSFGFIYVTVTGSTMTQACTIKNLTFWNSWAGILLDSPAAAATVTQCTLENLRWPGSGRMFGVVKGRNVAVNDFCKLTCFGGFATSFSATGNGATTQYSFPDNVFLTREATIKLNGVVQTLGVNYTWLASSNRTIVFASAPGVGVAVTGSAWTYGVEGLVEDSATAPTLPQGGNDWTDCDALQWQHGGLFRNAQLGSFENFTCDTCSDSAFFFDNTSGIESLNSLFIGWGATGIKAVNSSTIKTGANNTWGVMPAGQQVLNSGAGGSSGAVESTTSVDATSVITFGSTPLRATASAPVTGGTTTYYGPNGNQSSISAAQWYADRQYLVLKLSVQLDVAPGVGQNSTFTVLDINLNVLGTLAISGTSTGGDLYIPAQTIARGGSVVVKQVASATAATATPRLSLNIE